MRHGFREIFKLSILTACIGVSADLASASSFSFQGTFTTDDQVQLLSFTVVAPTTVTLRTYSYGGGTNAATDVIPAGGFDPEMTIFDSGGTLIAGNNDDSTCAHSLLGGGGCLDSYLQLTSLAAGNYTLALTQSGNDPYGPNLINGFLETGIPDFTGSSYGCSNGVFCDANGDNLTGNWAVDILGISTASQTSSAPEPGTIWLLGTALTAAFFMRRRINRS